MRAGNRKTGIRLRVVLEPDVALGPGKADLLRAIAEHGSISAAGRSMGMSYKRAWSLAEALNKDFREPLIAASKGGKSGGGASLTDLGREVLDLYARIESHAEDAAAEEISRLRDLVSDDQPQG